jgi:hypothetical protein
MAFSEGAVADLASSMSSKGIGSSKASPAPDSEPAMSSEDGETDVMHEIAGDCIDAIQSGSKDEAAKFLVELVERMTGKGKSAMSMGGDDEAV